MGLVLGDRAAKSTPHLVADPRCWVDREIAGCEFKDARLGDRIPQTAGATRERDGTEHPAGLPRLGQHQGSLSFLLE